jgi:anthranilate 1,2-dioxygenase small subunit
MTETIVTAEDGIDLVQRGRVEDFLTDYAHTIDDGRFEDWPGFFTEDGFYQVISRESFEAGLPIGIMACDGRGMMEDRVQALQHANIFEPHGYCHLLGRPRLDREAPDIYGARSNFQIVRTMQDGGSKLFATGKYLDRIVLEGSSPKFRERRVVLDSRRIDILLVLPL